MNKLLIGAVVTALVGVLTISAASAAGHGPVTFPHASNNQQDNDANGQPEATEAPEPSETPEASEAPEPTDAPEAADNDDNGDQAVNQATGDNGTQVAQVIADHFGVSQADVLALHDQGIGFGAIFKLYAIAAAKGISVNDLLSSIQGANGEHEFAFGKLIKSLSDSERAALEAGPKNLGALVSASHSGGSAHTAESSGAENSQGHGQGLNK